MDEFKENGIALPTKIDSVFNGKHFIRELVSSGEGDIPSVICTIDGVEVTATDFNTQWESTEMENIEEEINLTKKGAIEATVNLGTHGWLKDRRTYDLGTQGGKGISIGLIKFGNGTVRVTVSGPFGKSFKFDKVIPANDGNRLPFNIAWGDGEIKLSLCGKLVAIQKVTGV